MYLNLRLIALLLYVFTLMPPCIIGQDTVVVNIGVLMNLNTWPARDAKVAMEMASADIHDSGILNNSRLNILFRDCKSDPVIGAAAAMDLLQRQLAIMISGTTSEVTQFMVQLGNEAEVPVVTFTATDPFLSHNRFPFFVRTVRSDTMQMEALASIAKAYVWKRVAVIYSDDAFGNGILALLSEALRDVGSVLSETCAISANADGDAIRAELYRLMSMESRVFVMHVHSAEALRILSIAKELGMMEEGYVWICTDAFANSWDSLLNTSTLPPMQGVLGLRMPVENSTRLEQFTRRWSQIFRSQYPRETLERLDVYGLLAYDTLWGIALALRDFQVSNPNDKFLFNKSEHLEVFKQGSGLLQKILALNFRGVSGIMQLGEGELIGSNYEIVNVLNDGYIRVGYWSRECQLSNYMTRCKKSSKKDTVPAPLENVTWPGLSRNIPKGWTAWTNGKKLRMGVLLRTGAPEFLSVIFEGIHNETRVTGFVKDVFDEALARLDNAVEYDVVPFPKSFTYDDLVKQVYIQNLDGVIGDVTILASRSEFVDFTQPYTETGLIMVVKVKPEKPYEVPFMVPFDPPVWGLLFALVMLTGIVVAKWEKWGRQVLRQVGDGFWFAFSTIFFAQSEDIKTPCARVVVTVWLIFLLIITSIYTASLTSILIVKQLVPSYEDVETLVQKGLPVGFQRDSPYVGEYLRTQLNLTNLKEYSSINEFKEALLQGPQKGGVAAIFDELPYVRHFLSSECGFTMVEPSYRSGGFGFAFSKGSPLVSDISKGVMSLAENNAMHKIQAKWLNVTQCSQMEAEAFNSTLGFDSFKYLFIVTAAASVLLLGFSHRYPQSMPQNTVELELLPQPQANIWQLQVQPQQQANGWQLHIQPLPEANMWRLHLQQVEQAGVP